MRKLQNIGSIGRFFSAGEILNGPRALAGLSRLAVQRVLVISSKSVLKANESYIKRCLSRFEIHIISPTSGEPTLSSANEMSPIIKMFSPDIIVAIGGGSVIDVAKLAWVISEKLEIDFSEARTVLPVSNLRSNCTGFIAVPTTYGSGTENSSTAVFQNSIGERKRFIVSSELVPDIAVLDPTLSLNLPIPIAVNGLMDTYAHIIEGYVSKNSNTLIRNLAIGALSGLRAQLQSRELSNLISNEEDVSRFLAASSFAGIIQNIANPGLAHSLSHYCAKFGVNHGQGCGYFLPLSIKYNSTIDTVSKSYFELATAAGYENTQELLDLLETISKKFHLGKNIPTAMEFRKEIDKDIFFADPTISMNPVDINLDTVLDMMEK